MLPGKADSPLGHQDSAWPRITQSSLTGAFISPHTQSHLLFSGKSLQQEPLQLHFKKSPHPSLGGADCQTGLIMALYDLLEVYKNWEICWALIIPLLRSGVLTHSMNATSVLRLSRVATNGWRSHLGIPRTGLSEQYGVQWTLFVPFTSSATTIDCDIPNLFISQNHLGTSDLMETQPIQYQLVNWTPLNYAALAFGFPCNQQREIEGNSNHSSTLVIIELSWPHSYHRWFNESLS